MPVAPYAATRVREAPVDNTQSNVRVSTDTFVPDLSPAARLVEKIVADEKTKTDDTQVLGGESELLKLETNLRYNKDSGYLNRRGRAADTVVEDTLGAYDKGVEAITEGLANDDQRAKFTQRAVQRRAGVNDSVQRYSYDERNRYTAEQQSSFINNEQVSAAQMAAELADTDPGTASQARDRIKASLSRQMSTLTDIAVQQGRSADWLREETVKAASATHVGVLTGLMGTDNHDIAQKYFDANKDEMLPADVLRMEKGVEETNARGRSQKAFDEIVATKSTPEKQMAAAQKIKDPATRDNVQQRLQEKISIDNALEREANDDLFLAAVNTVEKSGDVKSVNPADWSTLNINQRNGLHEMARRKLADATGAQTEGDDSTAWLAILDYPAADLAKLTPAQFQGLFKPALTKSHFEQASKRWESAREAARSPKPGTLSNIQSDTDIIKGTFSLGVALPPDKWSTDNKLEYIRFQDDVASRINAFETQKGEKATADEKQKITNSLMAKVYIKKSFFSDPQKRVSDVSPEDAREAYVPIAEIPPSDITELVNLARSFGMVGKAESTTAARTRLGDRIERAYAAIRLGQSKETVANILKGAPR